MTSKIILKIEYIELSAIDMTEDDGGNWCDFECKRWINSKKTGYFEFYHNTDEEDKGGFVHLDTDLGIMSYWKDHEYLLKNQYQTLKPLYLYQLKFKANINISHPICIIKIEKAT